MTMLLIKGSYQVKGTQPDGDTVHFTPDNPTEWELVGGRHRVMPSTSGRAPLRLDGVDALETHYSAPRVHQPLQFGHGAADELLTWLGFTGVERKPDETVTAATPDTVPGFVLTSGADVHNRCVAIAGRGEAPGPSGTQIEVDATLLQTTANHHLLTEGLVYPTFYNNLIPQLRTEMTAAAHLAQTPPAKGLWPSDVTTLDAKITGMSSITDDVVILPKLFRRLVDYLRIGETSLTCFPAFLAGAQDRYRISPSDKITTGMHHVIEITDGQLVRMTHPVEDLVFVEA